MKMWPPIQSLWKGFWREARLAFLVHNLVSGCNPKFVTEGVQTFETSVLPESRLVLQEPYFLLIPVPRERLPRRPRTR